MKIECLLQLQQLLSYFCSGHLGQKNRKHKPHSLLQKGPSGTKGIIIWSKIRTRYSYRKPHPVSRAKVRRAALSNRPADVSPRGTYAPVRLPFPPKPLCRSLFSSSWTSSASASETDSWVASPNPSLSFRNRGPNTPTNGVIGLFWKFLQCTITSPGGIKLASFQKNSGLA